MLAHPTQCSNTAPTSNDLRRRIMTVRDECGAGSERAPPRRARGPRRTPSGAPTPLSPAVSDGADVPSLHPTRVNRRRGRPRSRPIHSVGQADPRNGCGNGWSRLGNFRSRRRMIFVLATRISAPSQARAADSIRVANVRGRTCRNPRSIGTVTRRPGRRVVGFGGPLAERVGSPSSLSRFKIDSHTLAQRGQSRGAATKRTAHRRFASTGSVRQVTGRGVPTAPKLRRTAAADRVRARPSELECD